MIVGTAVMSVARAEMLFASTGSDVIESAVLAICTEVPETDTASRPSATELVAESLEAEVTGVLASSLTTSWLDVAEIIVTV